VTKIDHGQVACHQDWLWSSCMSPRLTTVKLHMWPRLTMVKLHLTVVDRGQVICDHGYGYGHSQS